MTSLYFGRYFTLAIKHSPAFHFEWDDGMLVIQFLWFITEICPNGI